jgi:predicted RNase H-like nuclease
VTGGRVLGVDACPAGWIGICWSAGVVDAYVHAEIGELVAMAGTSGQVEGIAIDIPIGLADSGARQADVLARRAAGPRRASVFMTPVRAALHASTYQRGLALNRALAGSGVSSQAFHLGAKILQVDRWLPAAPCPVIEAHPELSFAVMAGAPLADSKATWAGAVRRRDLLAAEGIDLRGDLGLCRLRVGVDDVLDAAAVAWTARRFADGQARRLPAEVERFSDGIDCAIWS